MRSGLTPERCVNSSSFASRHPGGDRKILPNPGQERPDARPLGQHYVHGSLIYSLLTGNWAFEARPEVAGTCRPPCVFRTVAADTSPGRLMIHSTNNYNYNYKRGRAWVVTILSFS